MRGACVSCGPCHVALDAVDGGHSTCCRLVSRTEGSAAITHAPTRGGTNLMINVTAISRHTEKGGETLHRGLEGSGVEEGLGRHDEKLFKAVYVRSRAAPRR